MSDLEKIRRGQVWRERLGRRCCSVVAILNPNPNEREIRRGVRTLVELMDAGMAPESTRKMLGLDKPVHIDPGALVALWDLVDEGPGE